MKSLISFLCVISISVAFAEQSPVFLWGVDSVSKPSLNTITPTEFAEIIEPLKADKTLVVFVEQRLTTRDFSCANADTLKSCFAGLQGVSGKNYYASVESPIETLRSIEGESEINAVDTSGKLSNPLQLEKGKIIFITFDDDKTLGHYENLEKHDAIIASITSQTTGADVFFMYTAAPLSSSPSILKRERRETAADSTGNVFRATNQFLIYYTTLTFNDGTNKQDIQLSGVQITKSNDTAFSVTLAGTPHQLAFDITLAGGYFYLTNVMYNNQKFRSTEVYAPTDFSYFCGNLTLYGVGTADEASTNTLLWNSLQFQAPFNAATKDTFVFGDPWHCVGFFTGGILSGLLIVALLLSITFVGVCWMMDINTMDRFDDPKGKTITINASE